jgi:hypothetical protein
MSAPQTITLRLVDKEVSDPLPAVCIYCGKFTTDTKPWTFSWRPSWYLLTDFIPYGGGGMGYREVKMAVPVCEEHAHVLVVTKRSRLMTTILMLAVLAVAFVLSELSDQLPFLPDRIGFTLLIGVLVLSAVAALAIRIYNRSKGIKVKPARIDDTTLVLTGVSSQFRDALMQAEVQDATVYKPHF